MGLLDQPQNVGGLFSQLGSSGGQWGPLLMALGAGIAGKADQGWGAGIGSGLGLATTVGQNQRNEAIKQQQLQATLQHQQIMENLGLLNAQSGQMNAASSAQRATTDEQTRLGTLAERQQATKRDEAKLGGAFSQITAAAPQWQKAREEILGGRLATLTGSGGSVMRNALLGAAKITGENPNVLFETYVPSALDGPEQRQQKVQSFEAYMHNLKSLSEGYPTLSGHFQALDAFAPVTPPSNPATTTSVPMGGAPQAPVQAGVGPIPGAIQGPNARPIPSPEKLQILKQYANNPEARAAFDDIYGAGAADHFLQGGR